MEKLGKDEKEQRGLFTKDLVVNTMELTEAERGDEGRLTDQA